jgi:hypothetical protein
MLGSAVVTTATEYRQYAQECIESARAAISDPVRKQFLDIAKLWMMAADKLDAGALPHEAESEKLARMDGHTHPTQRGVESNEPSY